jgi:hypothetical protein
MVSGVQLILRGYEVNSSLMSEGIPFHVQIPYKLSLPLPLA